MESIPIAATALPFAGEAETGISVGASCGRAPPSRSRDAPTTMGCSVRQGEGEPKALTHGSFREETRYLLSSESVHIRTQSPPHPFSALPTMGPRCRLARGVSENGDLRRSTTRRACTRTGDGGGGAGVARCPPSFGRGRAVARRAHRKRRTGSEGRAQRRRRQRLHAEARRGSDARGRARVSLEIVAEVDGQRQAQRSGRSSISPDLEAFGDGRLARGTHAREGVRHERRVAGASIEAETSRDRSSRRRPGPRLAREVVGGRHPGSS